MGSSAPAQRISALLEWPRRMRWIHRGMTAVSLLALVTDAVVLVWGGDSAAGYWALTVSACGVLLATARPVPGLILTVAGCGLAVLVGANPTTEWTVVAFTMLSATLAGAPPVRCGVLVGNALYLLVRFSGGDGPYYPVAITAGAVAVAAAAIGAGVRAQWRYQVVLEQRAADAVAAGQREGERAPGTDSSWSGGGC